MMNCLQWFKSQIVDGNDESLKEEFKAFAKNKGGYFNPIPPYFEINDESVFYVDLEQDGNMTNVIRSYHFTQFVTKRIKEEFNKAIVCIGEKRNALNEEEKKQYNQSLISELHTLTYLNDKTGFIHTKEEFSIALNNIKDFLNDNNSNNVQVIPDEDYLGETVFGFKGKLTEARLLYNTLEEINLINTDTTTYNTFLDTIITPTSTMIVNLQSSLRVNCSNYMAAYILRKMEILFTRLTYRNIGNSKIILNKKGKSFTEGDLSKALTIFMQKADIDPQEKDNIDKAFAILNSQR